MILKKLAAIVRNVTSNLAIAPQTPDVFISGNFEGMQPVNVAVVATTNINLSTTKAGDVIDGYTLKLNDNLLAIAQTITNQKGIYTVGASSCTINSFIATKFETNEISTILVQNGIQNANAQYVQKTVGVTFNGTTFSPSLTFQQLPTSYPINNVWYVAENGNDTTGNGSISKPYATFAKAQAMASTADCISVFTGTYTEDWTVTKSLFIDCGIDNSVKLNGTLSFSQTTPFYTVVQGLQVNGNVNNGTNTGGWRMQECTITGDITIQGALTENIVIENCYCELSVITVSVTNLQEVQLIGGYYDGQLIVNNVGSVVYARDMLGLGTVTHSAGAVLLINDIAGIKKNGSGFSIISTATNASPTNFLAIGSVSTQQGDLSYGLINKTGSCPYVVSAGCNIAPTGNTFTGTLSLQNLADYLNANYTPTNYTPVNSSVKGHLQGINSALSAGATQVATQAQTDTGYSPTLAVGVSQMKIYNSKTDFIPTTVGRPQANTVVSASPSSSTAAPSYDFYGVCWSSKLGLFVAVSSTSNKISYSSNGITWADSGNASAAQWRTVCWSPELGLFVAVAQTGEINTSTDGLNWTSRTSPAANGWQSVCWAAEIGLFCAVAVSGTNKVMTSPDGINWTLRTPSNDSALWWCVTWSPQLGLFAAGSANNIFMTSPDGINWTTRATSAPANTVNGIAWSPKLGLFIAICGTGTTFKIMGSTDGITWSSRASIASGLYGVTWSPELEMFYVVTADPTYPIMTSFDGIAWTVRPKIINDINTWRAVVWSPELGIFCSVAWGGSGARVMTSVSSNLSIGTQSQLNTGFSSNNVFSIGQFKNFNNINRYMSTMWGVQQANFVASNTWTSRTAPNAFGYSEVCYSPQLGRFVAVSGNGGSISAANRVAISSDGITWTAQTASNDSAWSSVCWSPQLNLFVAVSAGSLIMSSPDGITWTNRDSTAGRTYTSVCWSPQLNMFIAVSAASAYMRSTDGVTWTGGSMPVNVSWQSVCWSPELGLFCAVAATGTGTNQVVTSSNGNGWSSRTSVAGFWTSVCWSNALGLFVAVSSSGTNNVMTSPDGINWTARTTPEAFAAQYVLWCPEISLLVAVGSVSASNKGIMTSSDGINWTVRNTAPNGYTYLGAAWSPQIGALVAVSGSNTTDCIMTSKSAHNAISATY